MASVGLATLGRFRITASFRFQGFSAPPPQSAATHPGFVICWLAGAITLGAAEAEIQTERAPDKRIRGRALDADGRRSIRTAQPPAIATANAEMDGPRPEPRSFERGLMWASTCGLSARQPIMMPLSRKRKLIEWPKCLALAALAVAGVLSSSCKSNEAAPTAAAPPEVAVVALCPERIVLKTELPGRTAAYLVAEIRPQVNGLIQKRLFQEGAYVKAGDVLYQIDPAPYEAAYSQVKAALATSEADLATAEADLVTVEANLPAVRSRAERYKGLVAIHAVGQQDYDDASASLRQAEATVASRKTMIGSRKAAIEANRAALESARINLAYTPIKAPISGRIGKSNITVGALATAYQATPLAVIQQLDPIYVDVMQANTDLLRLRSNLESGRLTRNRSLQRRVTLILEDGTGYPLAGALQFRDVTVDPSTGAVSLRLVFPNPHEVLLPGVFVRAVVEEGTKEDAILAPQQAIGRDLKGNPFAWIVGKDDKIERRTLELDRTIANDWLVSSGLKPGDRLVVEGIEKIRPGIRVHTVPFTRRTSGGTTVEPTSQLQSKGGE